MARIRLGQKNPKQIKKLRLGVSPLYLIMAVVLFALGSGYQFLIYTAVVILHELAHAEIAQRLGYSLSTIKLMPYGASLTGNFEGIKSTDEILIAIAGPAFNVFLAIPAVALWWLIPQSYALTYTFVAANTVIVIFNLLPVFPLDGGRILLAILSKKNSRSSAYRFVRINGFIFSLIFALLFIFSGFYRINISLAIIAGFMLLSSIIPDKNSKYERLYSMAFFSSRLKKGLPIREILVDRTSSILQLSKMLSGSYYTRFYITDQSLCKPIILTETQLEQLSLSHPISSAICDVITNNNKN